MAAAHLARKVQTDRHGPDPHLDFVIVNEFDRSISILENNGNNTFTRRQVLDDNDNPLLFPVFVAVDDMDRDGDNDIVAVNHV